MSGWYNDQKAESILGQETEHTHTEDAQASAFLSPYKLGKDCAL